jgi:hypothetical protein
MWQSNTSRQAYQFISFKTDNQNNFIAANYIKFLTKINLLKKASHYKNKAYWFLTIVSLMCFV